MADFVRGNPSELYAPDIVSGIMMHRRVDTMTDTLPIIQSAKREFSPAYRRVAPITLDVVWDHFLARHWDALNIGYSLAEFVRHAQSQIEPNLTDTPERFQYLNAYMWQERWLERYAELPFIRNVLQGMANRRPKLSALAGSFTDVEQHYGLLENCFWKFYPQMMAEAEKRNI